MKSKNITTSDTDRLKPNLSGIMNLTRRDKYFALSNLSVYYTRKNRKTSCKNNEFKISTTTWNYKC